MYEVPVISDTFAAPPNFVMMDLAGSSIPQTYDFREPVSISLHDNRDCGIYDFRKEERMDIVDQIAQAIEKPGKSRKGLADKLGKHQNVVTNILDRKRRIKLDELPIIRNYLELDPMVPIVGSVGAGDEAHFYGEASDESGETVPAPAGASPYTVAVDIRGESLGAGLNGWVAFYDNRQDEITPDLIGHLCVVGLDTGQVLIKIPRKAAAKGRFHLFPNASGEPIMDAKVTWAARVLQMTPKP